MGKCLKCYRPIDEVGRGDADMVEFHSGCSRKIFAAAQPPLLDYGLHDFDKLAEELVARSVTIPGVQEKLSLHLNRRRGERDRLTFVGIKGGFILKPPTKAYPELPEVEDVTMSMAEVFGLSVVPHSLYRLSSGEIAYMARRIDRRNDGMKLAMEDMCQLTGKLTEQKYLGSMEQVGKVLAKFSDNPGLDLLRLFDMTIYCFITGNADMHLKNWSVYESDGGIALAPAYDLVATALLIPDDPEETALTLNGKKRKLALKDFLAFGMQLHLPERAVQNSFSRFQKALRPALEKLTESFLSDEMKAKYSDLMFERAGRLKLEY